LTEGMEKVRKKAKTPSEVIVIKVEKVVFST
jgi:hypothetical protein